MGSNMEVVKLPVFNKGASRVIEFIMIHKLYLRMRIREVLL